MIPEVPTMLVDTTHNPYYVYGDEDWKEDRDDAAPGWYWRNKDTYMTGPYPTREAALIDLNKYRESL